MEFKMMAETMSNREVELILHLIYPYSKVVEIIRDYSSNAIDVKYENDGVVHKISFLPDDVYLLSDDEPPKETIMKECEQLYQYRQFMIARGYSEIWLNNPYVKLD